MIVKFNLESELVYLRLQLGEFNIDGLYHVVDGVGERKMDFDPVIREVNREQAKKRFGHAI